MEQSLAGVEVTQGSPNVGALAAMRAATLRYNVYAVPHKALRHWLSNALAAAGRVDPHDEADIAALAGQIRGLLQFCRTHLEKEEQFLHPAMEARRPASTMNTRNDHRDHIEAFARLESDVRAVETAQVELRTVAVMQLYRHLAVFVADNLLHMDAEETDNNTVLWAAYSDDELRALEHQLVASIPQEIKQHVMPWMVPAMNPAERASFLMEIRANMPQMAFNGVLASVQSYLTDAERRKLAMALAN